MKCIEVNCWESRRKHLIFLDKIVGFDFNKEFTTITLTSGKSINVTESESTIKEMLSYHNVGLVNENYIRTFYEELEFYEGLAFYEELAEFRANEESPYFYEDEDELPF